MTTTAHTPRGFRPMATATSNAASANAAPPVARVLNAFVQKRIPITLPMTPFDIASGSPAPPRAGAADADAHRARDDATRRDDDGASFIHLYASFIRTTQDAATDLID